jgi:N-acetylglucosamine-6-sulfatase
MSKIAVVLTTVALAVGVLLSVSYADTVDGMSEAQAQTITTTASAKPNIVFILTDDMRKDDLQYMPQTKELLQSSGMTFQNAFVSNSLCCPSRSTIMRGQYSHNTGVWSNNPTTNPTTSGGWQTYQNLGHEQDDVATRLHDAGYRTGLFGKYLNGYSDPTYVPPKWDRWFATLDPTTYRYFDYDVSVDGTKTHFGTSANDYKTDVLSEQTNAFIANSVSQGTPFFAYVAPVAPHEPATPEPDYAHAFDGAKGPRLPSFNEKDVSDKPPWMRQLPRLTSSEISALDKRHEKRIESLQSVDDLVAGVIDALSSDPNRPDALNDTYIFFTSDNGWHHGEHRIPQGKWRSYEEDVRVPLLVRGPGVAPGSSTFKLTLNTDFLPTFTDLADPAGTQTPPYVDGRTLEPVLHGSAGGWRNAILLEAPASNGARPAYRGIRTVSTATATKSKYVEYAGGARELYRLDPDPFELTNRYDSASPPTRLASRLKALKTCKANATPPEVTCQVAEGGQ